MNSRTPSESKEPPPLSDAIYDALWTASNFIGGTLVAISLGVIILTFPGRYSHAVLVPELVPVFSVPFGIVFLLTQYALAAGMKSYKALALVTGFFIVGMGLAYVRKIVWGGTGNPMILSSTGNVEITLARHAVVAGACISGLVFGAALLKDYLYTPRRKGS